MKYLILLTICFLSPLAKAQEANLIFIEERNCLLEVADCAENQLEKAFATKAKSALAEITEFDKTMNLSTPPLDWGKMENVSTNGKVEFQLNTEDGFLNRVSLNNLKPNHDYVLTLNGRPDLVGNDLLPETVRGNKKEKYLDLIRIKTNELGYYVGIHVVYLKKGNYHVRYYVKDTDDYKILLYHDYFKFSVK